MASANPLLWSYDLVASGTGEKMPIGAAVRAWGPTDDIFILTEWYEKLAPPEMNRNTADFRWYTCSDLDGCATSALTGLNLFVGDPVSYAQLLHPSLAVRGSRTAPRHLSMTLLQKWEPDCNGQYGDAAGGDPLDRENVDLVSWAWSTSGGLAAPMPVNVNDPSTTGCADNGVTESAFRRDGLNTPIAWACFTRGPHLGDDFLGCDNEANAITSWPNEMAQSISNSGFSEDHPSFDFADAHVGLVVAGTSRRGTQTDKARVHFPELVPEKIVEWDAVNNNWAEHSNVEISGDMIHHVWSDGTGTNATIRYATCQLSVGVDCTDKVLHWVQQPDLPTAGLDAQFPEIVVDGGRRFVVYQENDGTSFNPSWRVKVADQCAGDVGWTVDAPRPSPPFRTDWDQIIAIGNPVIALNRAEKIVHVVFAEIDNGYDGEWNLNAPNNADLWWYRTEYTACP